jgi:hypothetical protein
MSAGGKPPALSKSNSTPLATPMKGAKSQDVKEVVAILESALAPGTPAKSDAIDVSRCDDLASTVTLVFVCVRRFCQARLPALYSCACSRAILLETQQEDR